ncbi:hypothetical protein SCA6_018551 [Theobroma cacao]
MSSLASSSLPVSTNDSMSNENRRSTKFHPSIWGDLFLSFPSKVNVDTTTQLHYEELKQEVRRMLRVPTDNQLSQKLRLIDTIKRLGVSYHFEREIEDVLQNIYDQDYKDDNLEVTSLRFRLLREHGFNVQCETFNKFKDDKGNFKVSLKSDVKGLLELYEAAHIRTHGEHILEEALAFTTTHLESAKTSLCEYPISVLVSHARKRPIRKGLQRLEARRFISIYQEDGSHDKTLLKFAKLDFSLVQNLHKEELSKISRQILTKAIVMASTMDDIYDAYGTFEELQLFTKAIERTSKADNIPSLVFVIFQMKQLSQAYFVEAKWYHENYVPTVEEYMTNALVSSGYIMVTVTSFVGMGNVVTKETFQWASNNPRIVRASSIIARLMDDIVSHKFEQERGHVASAIECYMKQHGVSEEKACNELNKQIENAWKDINQELVRPPAGVPMPVLTRILNLARVMDFLYKEGDGYTHVGEAVKDGITSLMIDPIPI